MASACGQKTSEVSHASIIARTPNRCPRLSRVFPDSLHAAVITFEQFFIAGIFRILAEPGDARQIAVRPMDGVKQIFP